MDLTALRGQLRDIVGPSNSTRESVAHADLARRVDQQAALARLSRLAVDTHDVNAFLDRAADLAADTLAVDSVEILETADGEFLIRVSRGAEAPNKHGLAHGTYSVAGLAVETGKSIVVEDAAHDERVSADPGGKGSRAYIASPISNGDAWGVITVHSGPARKFGQDDVYFVESVANLIASVINRAKADQQPASGDPGDHDRFRGNRRPQRSCHLRQPGCARGRRIR